MKRRILKYIIPERIPGFASGLYNKVARTAIADYYRPLAEGIVAGIDLGKILDIGTGPGYLPIEIAKMAPNIKIDAIDLTKRMIKIAYNNAEKENVSAQVHFEVGDANNLRFEDNSYDMVISTGTLHAWKNPVRVINECYRVLKPGKEAWICDPATLATEDTVKLLRSLKALDRLAYKWASLTSRVRAYSINEIHEIIGRTEFKDYQVEQGRCIRIRLRK